MDRRRNLHSVHVSEDKDDDDDDMMLLKKIYICVVTNWQDGVCVATTSLIILCERILLHTNSCF